MQVQKGLHRNLRLWTLRLDLEESLASVQEAKAAYEHCMTLGVATPSIVLNYASFLGENKFFEEAFKAYEKVSVEWSGADRSGAERSGAERSGSEWSGVERSGAEWSGAERSGAERSGAASEAN